MKVLLALTLYGLFIVLASSLFSLPVYWLWNGLMPDIFHLPTITWNQAWGLLILAGMLFKSSSTTESK